MAVSTRQQHRENLRDIVRVRGNDDFDEESPRTVFGGGIGGANRRPPQPPQSLKRTQHAVLDALSDKNSELARFLFIGRGGGGQGAGGDASPWFASFRRPSVFGGGGGDDDDMPSMGKFNPSFYALALEPMDVRNERIIMLFEAYAIFGALFMGAVWILFEYGSPNGYGDGEGSNLVARRIFGFAMAVLLGVNGLLALFGALMWIVSINLNSSHQDFVFESRKALSYLDLLLATTVKLFIFGLLLGIYSNLSPYWPETIVAMVIVIAIYLRGIQIVWNQLMLTAPLECYHLTRWSKNTLLNFFFRPSNEKVKENARLRARELKERAYRERRRIDPEFRASEGGGGSVGVVLRTAAVNLKMVDRDVSAYEARLKEDWFHEAGQLKNRSVDCLSRYMPLRLAEEVYRLLEAECSDASV